MYLRAILCANVATDALPWVGPAWVFLSWDVLPAEEIICRLATESWPNCCCFCWGEARKHSLSGPCMIAPRGLTFSGAAIMWAPETWAAKLAWHPGYALKEGNPFFCSFLCIAMAFSILHSHSTAQLTEWISHLHFFLTWQVLKTVRQELPSQRVKIDSPVHSYFNSAWARLDWHFLSYNWSKPSLLWTSFFFFPFPSSNYCVKFVILSSALFLPPHLRWLCGASGVMWMTLTTWYRILKTWVKGLDRQKPLFSASWYRTTVTVCDLSP